MMRPAMIGFTGTQTGMTPAQTTAVKRLLLSGLKGGQHFVGIHGDCVGADAQFDALAREMEEFRAMIIYPGDIPSLRAHCTPAKRMIHEPRPCLERNRLIVDECDLLIACPKHYNEVNRSGTWMTIRYARSTSKQHFVIFPDGQIIPGSPAKL